MAYTIIHKKDKEKMAAMMSEMLSIGGRLMTCIEEMEEDSREDYGERYDRRYGMREASRYGNRYDDYDPYMERVYRRR